MRVMSDAEVTAAMPPLAEVVELVADGLRLLADGACDVRPKQGVSLARGSFTDAMPAAVPERGLLGLKWVSVFPGNPASGLPTASGIVVLNDPETGQPTHVLPATEITAVRTAAVTAACVRALAPEQPVTFLGAGSQAGAHVRTLTAIGAGAITLWSRRPEQAKALRDELRHTTPQAQVLLATDRRAAVEAADVLVTGLSIGLADAALPSHWLADDALLLPIDYASCIDAHIAQTATLVADDVDQFIAIRSRGKLGDYPTPATGPAICCGPDVLPGARSSRTSAAPWAICCSPIRSSDACRSRWRLNHVPAGRPPGRLLRRRR